MPALSDPAAILADPRFARVRERDRAADGEFVYAVGTTGVFCRPSCAARPARPENMAFFATSAEALAAGFRPCRRCRPLETSGEDAAVGRVRRLAAYIDAHTDETLSLDRLAEEAGLSPFHLQRTFRKVMGVSPRAYQAAARLAAFKSGLRRGEDVLGAAFEAGYGSTSRIYEQVDGALGMTPRAYRAGGAGERIVHAVRDTAFGPLMMAATARGVCFVRFGDDEGALVAELAAEYPRAELAPAAPDADGPLSAWIAALDDHLSREAPRPDLPLDLRGTAFQIKVWRFLLGLETGQAVSYAEVAAGAGAPRAVRAAASACAANRLAVLVPCHRAIRADGSLGGYRWGAERKRALLDLERRLRATG